MSINNIMKNQEFWMMVLAVVVALVLINLVVNPLMNMLGVKEGLQEKAIMPPLILQSQPPLTLESQPPLTLQAKKPGMTFW